MLKALSLLATISFALLLSVSCASKKKVSETDAPVGAVGGTDGQVMDTNVSGQNMAFDAVGSDGGNIAGLRTVNFDYDSATLSSEVRRQLAENGDWIKANSGVTVQIEGHCDGRGSVEYNLALGERRAKSVKTYLTSLGIDSKRLTIISYGEEKPIDATDSEAAYGKNRRANFVPLAQ